MNCDTIPVQSIPPRTNGPPDSERDKQITKLETKASSHAGQDIVTRMPITRLELITISTVTIRNIWHKFTADFLHFGKFPPHICESNGATYRRKYETFSAL